MRTEYRGYEISAQRMRALGGWDNVYFTITRQSDGLIIEDSFTSGAEKVSDVVAMMKTRVDAFIETKGASECMEEDWAETP